MANFLEKKKILNADWNDKYGEEHKKEWISYCLYKYLDETKPFPNKRMQLMKLNMKTGLKQYEEELEYNNKIIELRVDAKDRIDDLTRKDANRVIKATLSEIKAIKNQANKEKTDQLKRYKSWGMKKDLLEAISEAKRLVDYVYKTVGNHDKTDDIIAAANKYFQKVYGFKPELRESRTL